MLLRNDENFDIYATGQTRPSSILPTSYKEPNFFLLLEQLIPRQAAAAGPEQARVAQAVFFKKPRGRLNQIYTT